ncbi:MAG: hypothetical protein ACI9DC_003369 [Gammaproteobacteria bacterium]|jgi:hypothetical protein
MELSVIDANVLLCNLLATVRTACQAVGIGFVLQALSWQASAKTLEMGRGGGNRALPFGRSFSCNVLWIIGKQQAKKNPLQAGGGFSLISGPRIQGLIEGFAEALP